MAFKTKQVARMPATANARNHREPVRARAVAATVPGGLPEAPTGDEKTRQRLLHAAGQIFADKGFRSATVREICAAADANIAAVNYHFGGKDQLYHAALSHFVDEAAEQYPLDTKPDGSPPDRLQVFVASMLKRITATGKPAWHGKLMMREMMEPTSYMEEHLRKFVLPCMDLLHGILRDWTRQPDGTEIDHDTLRRLACSVIAQVMLYHCSREMIVRIYEGDDIYSPASLDRLAEHIADFSACAINKVARGERI